MNIQATTAFSVHYSSIVHGCPLPLDTPVPRRGTGVFSCKLTLNVRYNSALTYKSCREEIKPPLTENDRDDLRRILRRFTGVLGMEWIRET